MTDPEIELAKSAIEFIKFVEQAYEKIDKDAGALFVAYVEACRYLEAVWRKSRGSAA